MVSAGSIVLATLNAKYAHASFGLRYLLANMGELRERATMLEFDLRQKPADIASQILAHSPLVVGLGIYIWNVGLSSEVARLLKARAPQVKLVLGGPEVSYETETQAIFQHADYVITDEGDLAWPELCRALLAENPPAGKIIRGGFVPVTKLQLPYSLYDEKDVAHRVIYVEASRGCPFTCEFCLSSLDVPLRRFPLESLLPAFQDLLDRGVQHFKFVDRTFNLSIKYSLQLLEFFLARHRPGLFLHFEMIPDRLPEELRDMIRAFPPGSLQFEVGIQTFNTGVAERIKRKQDYELTVQNLGFLLNETGSYIHADLIYGLPGETLESFAAGFDRLVALRPQEIQVNRLKRLRGTPIVRHDAEFEVKWDSAPPYEIISNRDLDAGAMNRLGRFAKFWDHYSNSRNFIESAPLIWAESHSAFHSFQAFTDWISERTGRTHGLPLDTLAEALFDYLTTKLKRPAAEVAATIWRDYSRGAQRDMPKFLRPHLDYEIHRAAFRKPALGLKRQARHFGP